MEFIYNTIAFENYGIAIIFFTIFVRLLMLPLNIKQQKSMERQQALMPQIEALKRQYKDDPRKLQEEQTALFSRNQINPYSGCLPLLIQYPLIIVVYKIIRQPLTFIAGYSVDKIKALAEALNTTVNNEIFINTTENVINMKFLGIFDLGLTPNWRFWTYGAEWKVYLPLLLIPILSLVTAYMQQYITMSLSNNGKKKDASMGAMNGVLKVMPLISLVFTFILPAGVGLYWVIGNILGILQSILLKKVFVTKKEGSVVDGKVH